MSSNNRPWYKWFPKDFYTDEKVQCLPPVAELIYRRALDLMWQSNEIQLPNSIEMLSQSIGKGIDPAEFKNQFAKLMVPDFSLFQVSDCGKWIFSKRLRFQADEVKSLNKKRKKASQKRWESKRNANANQVNRFSIPDTDTDSYTDTDKKINTPPTPPKGGQLYILETYPFPKWLNTPLFKEFCSMRVTIRKPITSTETIKRLIMDLKGFIDSGHDQQEVIQSAIDGCWLSFYPPKNKTQDEYI